MLVSFYITKILFTIDTANYEKDNRSKLFGPIYREIRQGGTSGYVLKATYHVGEEFPALASGLRAIDEVLNFLDYRSNDRLGHALALGIEPYEYYGKKRSNILCSIGEYLDDLVWMYSVLVESNQDASFDEVYRNHAEKVLHIEVSELYIQCVARVQRLLQEKVLQMNIFIEAKPSSNKKISHVQKYSDLPALNISSPVFDKMNGLEIPMSINTDDSSIFLTNLVNEYSMLAALIREGYSKSNVYSYIERLAIASNVHSFISEC